MIKVLVVDDHPIVRHGLKQILAEEPDMEVSVEATNAAELMQQVQDKQWDVIVLDITLPDRSGIEVLKDVKAIYPELPVLILSMHPEDQYATRVLKAGAAGYVTKKSAGDELVTAIRKAVGGGRYISPSLAEKLAMEVGADQDKLPHDRLSDREFQVMCLLASGKRLVEIADELSLSVKTISTYRGRILGKMGVKSNAELTIYCMEHDLLNQQ
jgi:DNA-binding NarL/FixJ family response regulator